MLDPRVIDLEILRGERERRALIARYDWSVRGRENQQVPPGDWRVWLVMAGRGYGKTRTGAETVRAWSEDFPAIGLIGRTLPDARDLMVEGPSGLLAVCPPWRRAEWIASKRQVRFASGAVAHVFTSQEPEMLRGPQHQKIWADEVGAWYDAQETWNMAMFGLRVPPSPQVVVTTTPRNIGLVRELVRRGRAWMGGEVAERDLQLGRVVITSGSTHENAANLDPAFLGEILNAYEGTRIGRQEIDAELLTDVPGALWRQEDIRYRDPGLNDDGTWRVGRCVVAIDPAATSGEDSDETGIIAGGVGGDGMGYVLADESLRGSPGEWASQAVRLYHRLNADEIVAEVNNGGEMVAHTIHTIDPRVPVRMVHATRGKDVRALPVVAKYEQSRIFHVKPFPHLEDQMTSWDPLASKDSPDRLDANVWLWTHLLISDSWGGSTGSAIA